MGSSKKHRDRGGAEAAEEAPAAAGSGATPGAAAAGRPREHRKHRHRGGERRGKRSRSRGERSGGGGGGSGGSGSAASSSRRGGASEEPGRSHGRGSGDGERKAKRERKEEREEPAAPPKASGAESSLSVEETNKLRAKLGLKPLETSSAKKEAGTKEDPVAAEIINPLLLRQRQELREKLAAAKEKRILNQKLGKVRALGAEEPWLEDAAAWIQRSRKLQQEKEMAEKRAKLLEEMEQEFGVSTLVEEEFLRRKKELYSCRDLQGLRVEHSLETFREGETLELTLKDRGVLEAGEDVLQNLALVAQEQAQEGLQLRQGQPHYDPYPEQDPASATQPPQPKVLLPKYSDPPQRPSFRLGPGGGAPLGGGPGEGPQAGDPPGPAPQSLQLPPLRLAPEYLTPEEMVTFRKPRRKVRRLRRKALKADDLLPLAPGDTQGDFGSRARGRGRREQEEEEEEAEGSAGAGDPPAPSSPSQGPPPQLPSDDPRVENMDISSEDEAAAPGSPPGGLEEEEELQELQLQLQRSRRLRQLQALREQGGGQKPPAQVLELLRGSGGGPGPDPRGGSIVFNATSEFCRTLGEIPTYGLAGNREEQEELMALERSGPSPPPGEAPESEGEENVGWSSVNLAEERQHQNPSASSTTILDEEPIVNRGLAAALLLCQNKGLLETTLQKVARVKAPNKSLPTAVYCIEDKMALEDKYSRREEFRGFTQEFREKEGYRPEVKIEYVDETGRRLTPKEAFRQLSHRFHGKGSGKMKTERRMKKLDEEALLKKMSSSDTPLGTVALLQEKQKAQKTPFIVLSGSGKSMNANTITK
ncbi:U4/U6.U5 tri-snRNP-associated protein 1 [Pogoniulus pusillus]|uniref:U4/U6.U5 tri-snRNP-associated protein 1 n=1 Tax=Pogoniulus pusillus TaxID=488313 RepID=UPI0030B9266C